MEVQTELAPCPQFINCICRKCIETANLTLCALLIKETTNIIMENKKINLNNKIRIIQDYIAAYTISPCPHTIGDTLYAYPVYPKTLPANITPYYFGTYDANIRRAVGGKLRYILESKKGTIRSNNTLCLPEGYRINFYNCNVVEWNIYRSLASGILHGSPAKQLIPDVYAVDNEGNVYIEKITQKTLHAAYRSGIINSFVMVKILCVIHGLLAYLYRKFGFVHGNLTADKIMLRGEGKGYKHLVPIILRDDSVEWISLPFCPMIVDFSNATTNYYSRIDTRCTPYMNELTDILSLYYNIHSFYYDRKGEDNIISCIETLFYRENYRTLHVPKNKLENNKYPLLLPLHCEELTHINILREHLNRLETNDNSDVIQALLNLNTFITSN